MDQLIQFSVSGLVLGCIYAIAASGLVLTYTTTGVFNFAHGAVAGLCAFAYWWLTVDQGLPIVLAIVLVVAVIGPVLGVVLERVVFRQFQQASVETTLVVTIALTLFFLGLTNQLFDPREGRQLPLLLGDRTIELGPILLTWDEVLTAILAAAVAGFLRFFLFQTRIGTTMRAVVDDPSLAELAGAKAVAVARASWALGFGLAGLSGILFASGRALAALVLAFFVLNAYAGAMVGRLQSLALTFAGALGLGLLEGLTNVRYLYPPFLDDSTFWNRFRLAIPAIFLLVAMLALPATRLRSGARAGRDDPAVPNLRTSIIAGAGFVAFVALLTEVLTEQRVIDFNRGLVFSVAVLALTLVTGYGGQISLAPFLFMAVGAVVMANVGAGNSPFGLIVAGVVCAPLGVAVALPALRLQGLYLALATFAFALAGRDLIVGDDRMLGRNPKTVGRPDFGIFDTTSDQAFSIFLAAVFAVIAIGLLAFKRSKYGRAIVAQRDSEIAIATLGLDIRLPKMALFAASAAISGVAGALLGGYSTVVADINFDPINNLVIFLYAFVGGVTSISGAFLAGLLYAALTVLQSENPSLGGVVFAAIGAAAVALGRQPNGIAGLLIDQGKRVRRRWAATSPVPANPPTAASTPAPPPSPPSSGASRPDVLAGEGTSA